MIRLVKQLALPSPPYTVIQAHRLSSPDTSQVPVTTTTPDDVFYILKVVLSRLLSTGSLTTVEKMLDQLRDIMDKDYVGVIKKKLDDVYRTSGSSGPNARGEKAERENRVAFIESCLHIMTVLSLIFRSDSS